jgi:phosphate starvation-inducible PhoH-like protein
MLTCPGDPYRRNMSKDIVTPSATMVLLASREVALKIDNALYPYSVHIAPIAGGARLAGDELAVVLAEKAIDALGAAMHGQVDPQQIDEILNGFVAHALKYDLAFRLEGIPHPVRPRTLGQVAFLNAILYGTQALTFGVGSTGTGKTHLALAAGLSLLESGTVPHLVITRPHVIWEGETMTAERRADVADEGQLTPIEDELYSFIGADSVRRLKGEGRLEIVPLGRLRGRTFNESMILVDDAQNLLAHQMRMVLTRLGHDSRIVITGDPASTDLRSAEESGLPHVLRLMAEQDFALIHSFRKSEIVRNPVVAAIEALYERDPGTETPMGRPQAAFGSR